MTEGPQNAAEPILRLRGIGRRFGGLHAVREVDLDVAHGGQAAEPPADPAETQDRRGGFGGCCGHDVRASP